MKHKHIEIFTGFLNNLMKMVEKIERHANGDGKILHTRLIADMFPLATQVEIAASFALRSCCPIARSDITSFGHHEKSFTNLKTQLHKTIEYIAQLDSLENDLDITIEDKAGPAPVSLPAEEFLLRFAYPNFYFHFSMAYAIGRANGIPLTKGDFDGIHQYPVGFSFENNNAALE